jgi:hypothetical protein
MNQKPTTQFHPDSDIQFLTHAQLRAVRILQQQGIVEVHDSRRARALGSLVARGIAENCGPAHYRLTKEWEGVDPESLFPALRQPRQELPPLPDPPAKEFNRAPAVYSNPNHEDRIDYILKHY